MRDIGVGMVGYGFMGRMHTYCYTSLPFFYDPVPANIRLEGVCARSDETRKVAVEQGGYKWDTPDLDTLLRSDKIDVVNICTPNYLHYEQVMGALSAGKHVYCDKPLAMSVDQAEKMNEAAENSGLTCQVTFHNRFAPATMRAIELVREGALGEVVAFRGVYLHSGYTDPSKPMSWRLDVTKSGAGALFDLGSHIIDLALALGCTPNKVMASLPTYIKERPVEKGSDDKTCVEVDDVAVLMLELANGMTGTIEASRVATGTEDDLRIEVHGTKGAIMFDLMQPNWLYYYDGNSEGGDYGGMQGFTRIGCVQKYPKPAVFPGGKTPVGWTRMHIASIYDFIRRVAEGLPGEPSFADGLAVQKVMEAAVESDRDKNWCETGL